MNLIELLVQEIIFAVEKLENEVNEQAKYVSKLEAEYRKAVFENKLIQEAFAFRLMHTKVINALMNRTGYTMSADAHPNEWDLKRSNQELQDAEEILKSSEEAYKRKSNMLNEFKVLLQMATEDVEGLASILGLRIT